MKVARIVKAMEYIDDVLISAAASDRKERSGFYRWWIAAACLVVVVVGFAVYKITAENKLSLKYNEISSYMTAAPRVDSGIGIVESDANEVSALLGYDIENVLSAGAKDFDCKYLTYRDMGTDAILGVLIDGFGKGSNGESIWIEIMFDGLKPMIDYDFENEERYTSSVNGIEVFAAMIPEETYINAAGEEKNDPATYTASFDVEETNYCVLGYDGLNHSDFDKLVCALIKTDVGD